MGTAATALAPGPFGGTQAGPLTAQGTILGTLQYMAPEQIEGEAADARTDIFAFGAVLYEMLTGRKAFEGKSQASLLGAILKDQPPAVSQIQPIAPLALDYLVRTCLAKDPGDRFQSAHDLLSQLRWIAEGGSAPRPPAASRVTASISGMVRVDDRGGLGRNRGGPRRHAPARDPGTGRTLCVHDRGSGELHAGDAARIRHFP